MVLGILALHMLCGCANTSEKKEAVSETEKQQVNDSVPYKSRIVDTIKTAYPIQIGNHKGLVSVTKIVEGKPKYFTIELDYRNEKVISVYVDKSVLIDSNKIKMFIDTLNLDYTNGAFLTSVKYKFIRGNTLYFEATLENKAAKKEVYGRFNLFYGTPRKGEVYGWITDSIHELLPTK